MKAHSISIVSERGLGQRKAVKGGALLIRFVAAAALLMGLLALLPARPARADLTPGHLDTGFDPGTGADDLVYAVALQPDGKVLIGGGFTTVNGVARYDIARLNADGSVDASFAPSPGANGTVYAVAVQPDGKVLIGGNFTTVNGVARNRIARLNANGSLDTSFNPGTGVSGGGGVYAMALQPDGKVLIGGNFTTVNGVARYGIARLNADGSVDASFAPSPGANGTVYAVTLQSDGKVLIGGLFTQVNGVARSYIARLTADGALDTLFFAGASDLVRAIVVQFSGKVLIGGWFTTVNGTTRNGIARLNTDGSLDTSFDPGTGANNYVYAVALRSDGKVLIGGTFTTVNGVGRNRIARLNADGTPDTGFDTSPVAYDDVQAVALQPDGKVLIGGGFTYVNGVAHHNIARLNANGSLDTSFDPGTGANDYVYAVALQPDGKVLIGGSFTTVNGVGRNHIARLNTNGSLDTGFNPGAGADGPVWAVALLANGKALIGGSFTHVNGVEHRHIARLNADGSLDADFNAIVGEGPYESLFALMVQPDGKILIGGWFTWVNGVQRNLFARLNADGSLDTSFDPGTGADNVVRAVAVQPDGKALIGGNFTTVNGVGRNHIARLNVDGSPDASFDPGTGANNEVDAMAVQPDGKVLIGGSFTTVNGVGRNGIARLNANGSLDTGFDPGTGVDNRVDAVALQPDGKVLIADNFGQVNGQPHVGIARLNGATAPAFTSAAPAAGTVGTAYTHAFTASGFPRPTFHVTSGSLPPGLALNEISGLLAGTPTAAGTYHFIVTASNYVAPSATQNVTLVITTKVCLPIILRQ